MVGAVPIGVQISGDAASKYSIPPPEAKISKYPELRRAEQRRGGDQDTDTDWWCAGGDILVIFCQIISTGKT